MLSRIESLKKRISNFSLPTKMGLGILALSFLAFLFFYHPILIKELVYLLAKPDPNMPVDISNFSKEETQKKKNVIVVADNNFAIIIPKIGVNSKVVSDVNPNDSAEYQLMLTKGVAHAKGSVYPGEAGNSFYFAHSSDNLLNANRYNSVFYLLNKIQKDDVFYLVYNKQIFKYKVTETKVVKPEEINYMKSSGDNKTATLMTCWPAGTTLKRLIVLGELSIN